MRAHREKSNFEFVICFLIVSLQCGTSKIFNTVKQTQDFDISYPHNVQNERGLRECKHNSVCSVLHRRFWFNLRVQRICQCPDFKECPYVWSNSSDNYTVILNNRSQMKFCDPLTELHECESNETALTLTSNTTSTPDKYNRNQTSLVIHQDANLECQCQYPAYWKLQNTTSINDNISISHYMCAELQRCTTNEFCGNIRADYFSSFYQCSCPMHHMCLYKDRRLHNVTELLYEGLAYEGICKSMRIKSKPK